MVRNLRPPYSVTAENWHDSQEAEEAACDNAYKKGYMRYVDGVPVEASEDVDYCFIEGNKAARADYEKGGLGSQIVDEDPSS